MSSEASLAAAVIWLIAIVLLIHAFRQKRRRRRGISASAAGAIYGWLNDDKRQALEIIVEKRAEARDPEDRDGNLPDLEHPKSHP
jgi:hypothetical protein